MDWTGNKKSIYTTLGASNHVEEEREENDFYATEPKATKLLLENETFNKDIWEVSCGSGDMSKVLEEYGYNVKSTDLYYRGYGEGGIDFLSSSITNWHGDIITNPPYKCFSSDTQCYTKRGWLYYNELNYNDYILSVNPNSMLLEWSKINKIIIKNVNEELIHFNKSHIDILCTKDHRMFAFNKSNNKLAVKNEDLIKSQDIKSTHYVPRLGYKWNGNNCEYFILPSINGYEYAQPKFKNNIKININDWLKFFGLWLADGYCRHTKNSYGDQRKTVGIKQSIKTSEKVREIIKNLPFSFKEYKDNYSSSKVECINFEIHNEQLWSYLKQFGKSNEKFIPDFIKNLNIDLLNIFLDHYFFGDGSLYQKKGRIYRTTSIKLIEDIQEILLKIGYLSHITCQFYKNTKCNIYSIIFNPYSYYNKIFYPINSNGKSLVKYNGIVWCVNLEKNGVFLVRRNGKEIFSGNCAEEFVYKSLEIIPEGNKVAMFLKILFLEGQKRKKLFITNPPETLYVSSARLICAKNGKFDEVSSSAVAYGWFVWRKGFKGDTKIKWI